MGNRLRPKGWKFGGPPAVLVVFVLAGCGSVTASSTIPESTVNIGDSAADLLFECGAFPFYAELLSTLARAEMADTEVAKALREFLARPEIDISWLPDDGWWLVGSDGDTAGFVASTGRGREYAGVGLERDANGWRVTGWGDCRPRAVLDGLGAATWTLDPDEPAPGPETRRFTALVTELACASGQPSDGRLAPPVVIYEPRQVLVIFGVRPLPGAQLCPGNPASRVTVELSEPLGDRALFDGSMYPPHDPSQPWP